MTAPLWTAKAALGAMTARATGALPEGFTGLSIDSRTVKPGELYFAIRGDVHDGHDFAAAALRNGAAAAVVSEEKAPDLAGAGLLVVVGDVLAALGELGRAARARSTARIVAVTGSVGKTGTKEALRQALSRQGRTHAAVASFNNHWGVPLTLARMPADTEFGVFEIGMNHHDEIRPLVALVRPHVAVVTTIAPVHLAFFASTFAIADAKGEIFSGLEPGGTAIVDADIPESGRLVAHAMASPAGRVVSFGEHASAAMRLLRVALKPEGSCVEASLFGEVMAYRLGSPGRHVAQNSLAMLAAIHALGADVALAALALREHAPPVGRGAREALHHPAGAFTLVDESYNANPASVRAALENLGRSEPGPRGRRIAVLGDMLELGDQSEALHLSLAETIAANRIDLVFAAGPDMGKLFERLPPARRGEKARDSAALEAAVLAAVRPGDVVMVKGSLGSRMGPIVKALKARFAPSAPAHGAAA